MLLRCSMLLMFALVTFFSEEVFSKQKESTISFDDQKTSGCSVISEVNDLRAFRTPSKEETESAVSQIAFIFAIVGIVFIAGLVLFYYFYEPSVLSSPYKQTERPERPEGFVPYRKSSRSEDNDW
ncbi:MAG TPA: hypothetical protein PKA63_00480 [Oligoflexia bacterium]|mgnify:CR=1 FL=1|nr:hypothetical protein [Oligoflexia bacterium]HMP47125.1 hypothetical protein [Oligoflexia bacterium]